MQIDSQNKIDTVSDADAKNMNIKIKIDLNDLFPDARSFIIFLVYTVLFVNHGLLTEATKNENGNYNYNPAIVVVFTEFFKLMFSIAMVIKNDGQKIFGKIKSTINVFYLYFITAILYSVYNNLAFYNLQNFQPAVYILLLQFRTVLLGIVYELAFQKKLSKIQWTSLVCLTIGCTLIKIDLSTLNFKIDTTWHLFPMFIQLGCSCIASVFNEVLIKKKNVDLWYQNVFMYTNGFILNALLLFYDGGFQGKLFTEENGKIIWPRILLIANQVAAGISTSFLLKYLNSIVKAFSGAVEMVISAILSNLIFGLVLENGVLPFVIVFSSMYLYALNPVKS